MIRWLFLLCSVATGVAAQVTVDPDRSAVKDGWWSLRVELGLSDITPYRVFTLDDPRRLVLDFADTIWDGVDPALLLSGDRAAALRVGPYRPGWSRMVIDLAEPLRIAEAGMRRSDTGADLTVVLERASPEDFAAAAGPPPDVSVETGSVADAVLAARAADTGNFVVVIDPGHGGIDPGAERDGLNEAELMLVFAREVAAELGRVRGVTVVLTRNENVFVPLFTRMSIARSAGADLLISLHADALAEDDARGASVYTLSEAGEDRAAQQMVERHERGDLLAGVDLRAQGDRVATALMDMARAETGPAGAQFADNLVAAMRDEGVYLNSRPRREGRFAVLSAADFPSVLLEAGFLSNAQDRAMLASGEGRARIARAIAAAVAAQAGDQSD
ncbi:MAG: N-acetylmuramoyl-L-alanine amidase [Pseudomonadota bacterium]